MRGNRREPRTDGEMQGVRARVGSPGLGEDVSEIPEVKMASMCETCAYRKGSIANLDKFTRMKTEICEILGEPFLCHANRGMDGELISGQPSVMCAGFTAVMQKRIDAGFYKSQTEDQRKMYEGLSSQLDRIAELVGKL